MIDDDMVPTTPHRFQSIFHKNKDRNQIYNEPLFECDKYIVVPTLGSIVPGWFLIIPKEYDLNFKNWSTRHSLDPVNLVKEFCFHLNINYEEVLWFEHGAANRGTTLGCGVEYAHLHVVINNEFDWNIFLDSLTKRKNWPKQATPYSSLKSGENYYVASYGGESYVSSKISEPESQFFRKEIATYVGLSEFWDYKRFAFSQNYQRTIKMYSN